MRRGRSVVLALVGVLLLPACGVTGRGPELSPAPSDIPLETATVVPTPSPTSTGGATSGTPTPSGALPADLRDRPRVSAAIADLAVRQSVQPADVAISAWTPVTWSDGALGCPEPGMVYTQSEVSGELLILRIDSGLYQYHSRRTGPFRYCADPSGGYAVGT